jgi:hypothetical protein
MLMLVANTHMRYSGQPDLHQDVLCEPSVVTREYFEFQVQFLYKISTFIVKFFAKIRMICSEDGKKALCAHCTQFAGSSALLFA